MATRIFEAVSCADLAAARELFREYAASLGFDLSFQNFEQELASLPGDYAPPSGRLLLAELNGKVAGCIALHRLGDDQTCEMKRLYLRSGCRGSGLGRALVQRVIDEAVQIGYSRMRLDSVAGLMDAAISLYRSFGFQEIPAYRANPQPGALYFELHLRKLPSTTAHT